MFKPTVNKQQYIYTFITDGYNYLNHQLVNGAVPRSKVKQKHGRKVSKKQWENRLNSETIYM